MLPSGRVRLFEAGLLAVLLLAWSSPRTSYAACSYRTIPDARERLSFAATNWSDLVIVGVVLSETRVEPDYDTPDPVDLKRSLDQNVADEYSIYRSVLRPEAVLKGQPPAGDLELPWLTDYFQCGTAPRLHRGERVMLFLKQWPTWTKNDVPQAYIWLASVIGGQVLLTKDGAFMNDYQALDPPQYLGNADEVIRRVANQIGSSEEATIAASVAATRPLPQVHGSSNWTWQASALFTAGLMLGCFIWLRRRHGYANRAR